MKRKGFFFLLLLIICVGCLLPVNAITYQDFENDWLEVDANNKLTCDGSSVHFANLSRMDTAYVYKDFGAGYFGDFEHDFDVNFSYIESGGGDGRVALHLWELSSTSGDGGADRIHVSVIQYFSTDNKYKIRFRQQTGGVQDFLRDGTYTTDLKVYAWVRRSGTELKLDVYGTVEARSNRGAGNIFSHVETGSTTTYQYGRFCIGAGGGADPLDYCNGTLENLWFLKYPTLTYRYNNGGQFRVDNATIANGTEKLYLEGTVVELASLPQNSCFVFSSFNWTGGSSSTNPYDFEVPSSNDTVWLYFGDVGAVGASGSVPVPLVVACVILVGGVACVVLKEKF